MAIDLSGHIHARWGVAIDIAFREHTAFTHTTHVPKLRCNLAAFLMDRIHDTLPTGESLFPVNIRNTWITAGGDVIDTGALGHN